uniref:Uncharacterized protein n=1 Tax=Lactuca sativa TaxID=4236 RepID=A0A9R1UCS2_LACSA|nr:hypothetical protein LSAT_V11C900487520 [Lactuca sativa]
MKDFLLVDKVSASVMALPSNNDVVDTSNTKKKSSCRLPKYPPNHLHLYTTLLTNDWNTLVAGSMISKSFLHNDGHNDILRAQKIWDQRILTKTNSIIIDVVVV